MTRFDVVISCSDKMKCYSTILIGSFLLLGPTVPLVRNFLPNMVEASSSSFEWLTNFPCNFVWEECCDKKFIPANMTAFKNDITKQFYGQHIALQTVYKAVKFHVTNPHPAKPLVMSFHGGAGVGKNFVTRMIIRNLYSKAEKSSFVHIFNSEVHFKDPQKVNLYKDQLQNWISGYVSKCGHSIFIFDEIDHMPEGLIDTLKPFLKPQPALDGIDYRKSIFIFLSNTGEGPLVKYCLDVWKKGKSRENISLSELQSVLINNALNQDGGLHFSDIIQKGLVDHFVPFLPLERVHVKNCIQDEMRRVRPNESLHNDNHVVEQVLEELLWFPDSFEQYSTSGCKKVIQKVALVLYDDL